ncbi:hypothetical protein ACW0TQ_11970 [Oceanobacillus sp. M60]
MKDVSGGTFFAPTTEDEAAFTGFEEEAIIPEPEEVSSDNTADKTDV